MISYLRIKYFLTGFFLFTTSQYLAQSEKIPDIQVCKYAWTNYFDAVKNYNSVCCVTDGFTPSSCSVYVCPGETFYVAGQVSASLCVSPPYTTTYSATWNFGGITPPVTDSANYFCGSAGPNDSMTPLHPVTIPITAATGTVYAMFYSYFYYCTSGTLVTDTPSVIYVSVVPDSVFYSSVTPDTISVGSSINVSYYSNITGPVVQPFSSINYGDGTIDVSSQHIYSDTGVYIISIEQIGAMCYHKQSDTVSVLEFDSGINENTPNNFISVFPNPFSNSTTFKFSEEGNYQIIIFDVTGKITDRKKINGKQFIYENEILSAGIYFYEVINANEKMKRGKLIRL